MSSSQAAHAEPGHRSFNPHWMRSAFHGPAAVPSSPRQSHEDESDTQLSQPVLSKNRYGREEVLVLMPPNPRAPNGLSNCPFFVEVPREPLAHNPPSELEERLQTNINSSKAMSSLTPAERLNVVGGATFGNPSSPNGGGPNSPQTRAAGNGWTPVKSSSWGRGTSQPGTPGANGRGAAARPMGRGGPPVSQTEEGSSPYGQKSFTYRGRGGLTTARGGSTTATNSRAQGLYDPRDPKDRPRNRLRSTSEEGDGNENGNEGGWSRPVGQYGRQNSNAWNKDDNNPWGNAADKENREGATMKSDSAGTMPEWMDDGDDSDKPEETAGGSFDDDGRYRQPQHDVSRQSSAVQREQPAPSWRPTTAASIAEDVNIHSTPTTTSNTQPQGFGGVPFAQPSPSPAQAAPGAPMQPPGAAAPLPDFYYLDPSEKERGPFKKDQMDAWFKMGYFNDVLKVRRAQDHIFKTLGELKMCNGVMTPFDYKETFPVFSGGTAPFGVAANLFGGSVWNDPLSSMYNPSAILGGSISSAFDTKRIEEEARRMELEKQLHLREILAVQRQAEEQAKAIFEKEKQLKLKEEELNRRLEEDRMRREMETLELESKVKRMEQERLEREAEERRKLEEEARKLEEERRKEQLRKLEEQKIAEEKRKREEEQLKKQTEAKRKLEEEERIRRAEAAAEEHRKLLQKKAEEDAARIRQQQAAAAKAVQEEEEKRRAAKDAEKMFNNDDDVWNSTPKTASPSESFDGSWQKATTTKKASKPAAAWSNTQQNAPREKTLREIQEEEERQMLAEQRELARLKKEAQFRMLTIIIHFQQESSNTASMQSGLWAGASQRISWNQATTVVSKGPSKPAWGGVSAETKPAASPAHWDGPSLQAANKTTAPPAAVKKQTAPAPAKPVNKNTNKDQGCAFNAWVVKRLKEINASVDADVLASFLDSVENPNEVDDYAEGYLGPSKMAKEFVKEYLQKRSESRKRKDTDKDDLSSASKAGSGSGTIGHGKKKKGKGQRLIVDGSCLGFRPAGDPNRINQGEIETVGLVSGQKR